MTKAPPKEKKETHEQASTGHIGTRSSVPIPSIHTTSLSSSGGGNDNDPPEIGKGLEQTRGKGPLLNVAIEEPSNVNVEEKSSEDCQRDEVDTKSLEILTQHPLNETNVQ